MNSRAAAALLIAVAAGVWLYAGHAPAPSEAVSGRSDSLPPSSSPPSSSPPLPKPSPAAAENIPSPQSAADALELILARKDPTLEVVVDISGPKAQGGIAPQSVSYTSGEPGHLYLIGVHTGNDELVLLLPGSGSAPARIHTSGKVDLPVDALKPGTWKLAFVVARQPLDLATYGWVFEGAAWKRRFAGNISADMRGLLPWGIPKCAPGVLNCESAYGAFAFGLEIGGARSVDVPAKSDDPGHKDKDVAKPGPAKPNDHGHKNKDVAKPVPVPRPPRPDPVPREENPECATILLRQSAGDARQELIDRMKTLKCPVHSGK